MKKFIISVMLLFCSMLAYGQVDYIPAQAFKHKETIKIELDRLFPEIYDYNYIPSLIEHESCISLKSSRCWNSMAELKTARERGVGLGQVTIAYNSDGTVRFDSLKEMRDKYYNELKEAKWESINQKPDLQIKIIVLMIKDLYKGLYNVKDKVNRLYMTDACYNGGCGGVQKERRACGLAKDCDPNIWFDNVERYCLKSKKVLYGKRSACDINRHHVVDVFNNNLPKYQKYYFKG